jgi:hypothetical protein
MMGPSHFGGHISPESFGIDGFVRGLSFDPQSFVPFSLAFGAASARIRSAQIARSIGVAAALPFGFVGHDAFRIPIDVSLVLGIRIALFWRFFPGCHFLYVFVSRENADYSNGLPTHPAIWAARIAAASRSLRSEPAEDSGRRIGPGANRDRRTAVRWPHRASPPVRG